MADVTTYPMTEEEKQRKLVESSAPLANTSPDVTGLNQPTVPTDLDSSPTATQPAPVGAPLPSGNANGALGGESEPAPTPGRDLTKDGGKPADVVKGMGGTKSVDVGAQVLADIKKRREGANPELHIGQGKQMNELYGAQGADVQKAGEQLNDRVNKNIDVDEVEGNLTPKQAEKKRFAWRNIYNQIAPEEMGLFLIDFGMRAMMAGESMGTLGALGAAGAGAMGALQGRREANEAKAVEDYKYSREQDMAERQFGLDERRVKAAEDASEAALRRAGKENDYRWQAQWLHDYYTNTLGYSDEEAGRIIAGGESYAEIVSRNNKALTQRAADALEKEKSLPADKSMDAYKEKVQMPDGSVKVLTSLQPHEIAELAVHVATLEVQGGATVRERVKKRGALDGAGQPTQDKSDQDYYDETD